MNYIDLKPRPLNWEWFPPPVDIPDAINFGLYRRIENDRSRLRAIVTVDLFDMHEPNAGHWLHVSVCRQTRLPTWKDLVIAAHELGYADRCFVQLLPPKSHWLNLHEFTLHLMTRLDAPTVPRILWDQVACDGKFYDGPAPFGGQPER